MDTTNEPGGREITARNAGPTTPVTAEGREPIMRYFAFSHLPPRLQAVSALYYNLATEIEDRLPRCAERTVALRKLLESKDAAVRAALEPVENQTSAPVEVAQSVGTNSGYNG